MLSALDAFSRWRDGFREEDQNPLWLDSLQGESPLLSASDCVFISDVLRKIKQGITSRKEMPNYEISRIKRNLSIMLEDFRQLVDQLKMSSESRQQYLETYPSWRAIRDRNILQLKKIAKEIDTDKRNCQISQVVGSLFSLVGGGICLASETEESRKVGSALMGLGNLTTAGTSVVEEFLLHENIEEARKTMEGDRQYLKNLWTWLKDTECLHKALDNIKSTDFNAGEWHVAAKNLQAVSTKNTSARDMNNSVKVILKSISCPPQLREEVSQVIGILVSTYMLIDRYSPVFNLASEGISNYLPRLTLAWSIFRSASGFNSVRSINGNAGLTDVQKRQVAAGMATDAVKILLTSLEIDSKSIEGQKITQVANALEKEGDIFKTLYTRMRGLHYMALENNAVF